ncbi:MAG: MoaD/ThiS family protein [Desulfobacterales bacterium]|nr:MoaD/ThiS family protein [Desulfobacterales bacterium]
MSIKLNIHVTHRRYTDGLDAVQVQGATVGDCIKHLMTQYPAIEKGLFDRNGKLLKNIEIYVNDQSAYPDELARQVKDGDAIHLTLMLAGG